MPTLEFKGKQFIYTHHLSVPFRSLEIDSAKSLATDDGVNLDGNLVINGDNLHALKALLPTYAGKVKCIYIDPPYNTGVEGWCYNDRVNAPLMREWIRREANPVDREDLERHDKWLCMMWPRLNLLHELLSEDGVIFISIDDNEIHYLRGLMNEIFGETRWLGTIVWRNVTDNNPTNVAIEHEYILCFAKNEKNVAAAWKSPVSDIKTRLVEIGAEFVARYEGDSLQVAYTEWFRENKSQLWPLDRYKYIDKGGIYTGSQSVHNPGREGYRYDIIHRITGKPCKQPLMGYRFPKETMDALLADDRILFGEDEDKIVELKVYASEYEDKLPSVINLDGRIGAYELREIFSGALKAFDNPKPSQLIKQLLSFVTSDNDIVLDSFAGSGTTGHAVLELNKDDGGNRRFILVEMEDYADQVTAERMRRVVRGISTAKDITLKEGLGGSFTFCTLGDEINITGLLKGGELPSYEALARYVFYTATGKTLGQLPKRRADWLIGETNLYHVHLIYQPDRDFLRSPESALNAEMVSTISGGKEAKSPKKALVFATAKFMGQKELTERNIEFCQLPYAIHRMLGD